MLSGSYSAVSETQKRRSFERRIYVIHGIFLSICLVIIGRLIELQIVKSREYHKIAQDQQYGGVVLSAKRGEILSRNSKTEETSILATNTTLDLLYIDPLVLQSDHGRVADALSQILLTKEFDKFCRNGLPSCPNELIQFYRPAFDPLGKVNIVETVNASGAMLLSLTGSTVAGGSEIADITEIQRRFARATEDRIKVRSVTFAPLLYSANKKQLASVQQLAIPGIVVNVDQALIFANPDQIDQSEVSAIARQLSPILVIDPSVLKSRMIRRPLRYVPIMAKLPPELSKKIRELKEKEGESARSKAIAETPTGKKMQAIVDPFRSVTLIPEHWRFYPDTKIGSHVVGFINALLEPQYGIERAYDSILRGQEGLIASVSDPFGGQIVSSDQKFIDPRDGATIVLTIDRFVQSKVEDLLQAMVTKIDAESGQVIVIDPFTGRILALANAPLFDNNTYASVYEKEAIVVDPEREKQIVIEIYNPENNVRMLKAYLPDVSPENRATLSKEAQTRLSELEALYDMKTISRYYLYLGDNNRREVFPTDRKGVWLKYKNNIGVGSYVNRTIQEVYEPGSVMKAITMATAIDQGEVSPNDVYTDTGAVKVDVFTIKNALNKYYGKVSMIDCINFSINTCMTSVSLKLGRNLFHAALQNFGFGIVTGIELDNEVPGDLKPWREWSPALLMTMAFGQGITSTPIQMATAWNALANGGKLVKPTIIDEIRHPDGTIDRKQPEILRQVIKPSTAATLTAMLVNSAQNGFAKAGKVKGHRIAGKTGTSQIAGPGGKYESGTGSTIATYAGYAPVDHPKFLILVKLDRPKKDDFGSKSAAPLFRDIAQMLFDYYGIPPDEK
ncbi:penicillin-binding protein 2 [Candidatus Peribacteria bacterium]|nr:penicillin-binding protein 2 [Candidatus Peribacteria bacterium]